MTKNVKTIIKYYLFAIGKVGLVAEKYGCECSKENLMPCKKKDISECIPGATEHCFTVGITKETAKKRNGSYDLRCLRKEMQRK